MISIIVFIANHYVTDPDFTNSTSSMLWEVGKVAVLPQKSLAGDTSVVLGREQMLVWDDIHGTHKACIK